MYTQFHSAPRPAVFLYDAECGICDAYVRFILAVDRRGTVSFAPLNGATARIASAAHPQIAAGASAVLLEGQADDTWRDASYKSTAILRALRYAGGCWAFFAILAGRIPKPCRDLAYDAFAARRQDVPSSKCPVPDVAEARRFLP